MTEQIKKFLEKAKNDLNAESTSCEYESLGNDLYIVAHWSKEFDNVEAKLATPVADSYADYDKDWKFPVMTDGTEVAYSCSVKDAGYDSEWFMTGYSELTK